MCLFFQFRDQHYESTSQSKRIGLRYGGVRFHRYLRLVEYVTLLRFLFGVQHYWSTLDFAFFILEEAIVKGIWCYIPEV